MSQPPPVAREGAPRIADRVIEDIGERMRRGAREYGTALQAHNGRRALQDLYEELLDGAHYVKQRMDEEDQALRDVVGDDSVRKSLSDVYSRVETIRKNPNKVNQQALEQRYVDDIGYLRVVVESLLAELVLARQTPPDPPPAYEIAGYQYRVVGNGEDPEYDESHDQNEIDDWVDGRYDYAEGYYPEYRVLLATPGWYRVDRENHPLPPDGGEYVPEAQAPARDDERSHGSPPPGAVLGGTDDGGLRVHCPRCEWDAAYPSLDLPTLAQVAADHAERCSGQQA